MINPTSQGSYYDGFSELYSGFSELYNYDRSSFSTLAVAVFKIAVYCTLVVPVYAVTKLCDRMSFSQGISHQDQKIVNVAQDSVFDIVVDSPDQQIVSNEEKKLAIPMKSYLFGNKVENTSVAAEVNEDKPLILNGKGLRKVLFFEVYEATLLTEQRSRNANSIISSDLNKTIKLIMRRDVPGDKISSAVTEGFKSNSGSRMDELNQRLGQLNSKFPMMKCGDEVSLSYKPGKGTSVSINGIEKDVIKGKDFADALFSVWLGNNPVQEDLKASLLGN